MMHAVYEAWINRFEALEAHLNTLDAVTGDGDHGATMLRGMRAAGADAEQPSKAFRKAAGGASGSLFSVLVGALGKFVAGDESLPDALAAAAGRISQMGQAVAGDKTLLDALIPASLENNLEAAVVAARSGCEQTIPMAAKRGRAKYVEGAGVGYVDAGATSVVEMLATLALVLASNTPSATVDPSTNSDSKRAES